VTCGFNKLSIAEDNWGQLKVGISFQEYVFCDDDVVMCEVQTLEQMMDEKFTSDVSEEEEEDDYGKSGPPALLQGTDTLRKYLMKSDVNYNVLAALSSIARCIRGSAESE
jgi:hypothetical protein